MYGFLDYRVHDVMTLDPETLTPDVAIGEAERRLEARDFNGLPVVDAQGRLLGVVTKLDLLRAFVSTEDHMFPPYEEIMQRPVETVMSRDVHVVRPRTPLTRVVEKMIDSRVKSFPVVDDDRLVGVVAREDVLAGLRRAVAGDKPSGSWPPADD